mmetsp:Transcript_17444/g.28197  ORF Transcript_17444/g.28197 Transcript_17444/m.28197 type:complete len:442 (+) Transcript_17444:1479-2804(+)
MSVVLLRLVTAAATTTACDRSFPLDSSSPFPSFASADSRFATMSSLVVVAAMPSLSEDASPLFLSSSVVASTEVSSRSLVVAVLMFVDSWQMLLDPYPSGLSSPRGSLPEFVSPPPLASNALSVRGGSTCDCLTVPTPSPFKPSLSVVTSDNKPLLSPPLPPSPNLPSEFFSDVGSSSPSFFSNDSSSSDSRTLSTAASMATFSVAILCPCASPSCDLGCARNAPSPSEVAPGDARNAVAATSSSEVSPSGSERSSSSPHAADSAKSSSSSSPSSSFSSLSAPHSDGLRKNEPLVRLATPTSSSQSLLPSSPHSASSLTVSFPPTPPLAASLLRTPSSAKAGAAAVAAAARSTTVDESVSLHISSSTDCASSSRSARSEGFESFPRSARSARWIRSEDVSPLVPSEESSSSFAHAAPPASHPSYPSYSSSSSLPADPTEGA